MMLQPKSRCYSKAVSEQSRLKKSHKKAYWHSLFYEWYHRLNLAARNMAIFLPIEAMKESGCYYWDYPSSLIALLPHHVSLVPRFSGMQWCLSCWESMLTVRIVLFMAFMISFDECSLQPQPGHSLLVSNPTSGFYLLISKEICKSFPNEHSILEVYW